MKKETDILDGSIINTQNFSYDMDLLIDSNGNNYTDTFIGNPTNLLGYKFKWFGNRLTEVIKDNIKEIIEYNYDGTIKSKIIYKNNTLENEIKYYYDNGKLIYEENKNNGKLYYVYDNDEIIGFKCKSKLTNTTDICYYVKDIFGKITKICDECGNVVVKYTYDAYGNILQIKGSKQNTIGKMNPILYKGYYYDNNINLYYCNTRYYNPSWGRWISPDSIEYLDYESISGLNLYCYCNNDPICIVILQVTLEFGP